jgi:hypothetical protein
MSTTDWISANTTLRGRPYTTKGYEFQREIGDDMHPNMDVIKCSQVGLTELQIRKMLAFLSRNRGTTGLMTFPDEKTFKKNSATRIRPILDEDKVFNGERDRKSIRSIPLYQIAKSFLHVVQCQESDATSTPADIVMNDEVDLSDQAILALFNSRLQNSTHKIKQRFSTPTFPSYGIDLGYQASDQRLYMARCGACNHWQHPEFNRKFICMPGLPGAYEKLTEIDAQVFEHLDLTQAYVMCEKCRRALDLGDPSLRQWVATYPNRRHHRGYQVTPFATQRLDPAYIFGQMEDYKKRGFMRGFFNTVLGSPYSDGNIRLDEEAIKRCFTGVTSVPEVSHDRPCAIGIDVGQTCHLVVGTGTNSENMCPFLFEAVPIERLDERVKDLMTKYRIVAGCIDRLPYTPDAERIMVISKGVIIPAQYVMTKEVNVVWDEFDQLSHAQINRTKAIDEVVRVTKNGTLRMSGYGHHETVLVEHMRDMVRDEQPETPAVWKKLTGQDHFFHALAFLLVSLKVKELERLKNDEEQRTEFELMNTDIVPGKTNMLDFGGKGRSYHNPLLNDPGLIRHGRY